MIIWFFWTAFGCEKGAVDDLVDQSKAGIEKAKAGVEKAKAGVEKAKELSQNVQNTMEQIKTEKQKVDEEISKLKDLQDRQFEMDFEKALVVVVDKESHLRCELLAKDGAFEIMDQMLTTVAWFVNGEEISQNPYTCSNGSASLGVGLGGKGITCSSIDGPHHRDAFYPYMAPKLRSDSDTFQCQLRFIPSAAKWVESIVKEAELKVLRSDQMEWANWPTLKHQRTVMDMVK